MKIGLDVARDELFLWEIKVEAAGAGGKSLPLRLGPGTCERWGRRSKGHPLEESNVGHQWPGSSFAVELSPWLGVTHMPLQI